MLQHSIIYKAISQCHKRLQQLAFVLEMNDVSIELLTHLSAATSAVVVRLNVHITE